MNREDVIRMAREAGANPSYSPEKWDIWEIRVTDLEHLAALIAAHEREECAKVCEAVAQRMDDEGEGPTGYIGWVDDCAFNIRARGEK